MSINWKKLKMLLLTALFLCFKDVPLKLIQRTFISIERASSEQIINLAGPLLSNKHFVSFQFLNTFIADGQVFFLFKVAEVRIN